MNEESESPKEFVAQVVDRQIDPVSLREVLAALLWTVLADMTIFRTLGYTGPAVFLGLIPVLMAISSPSFLKRNLSKLISAMLWIVAARLIWLGSGLAIFSGVALTIGLAMSAAGVMPLVTEGAALAARCSFDGASRLSQYRLPHRVHQSAQAHSNALAWLFPLAALLAFGSIFVFANPNLFTWVSGELTWLSTRIMDWIQGISVWEAPFCLLALLVGVGLMRPAKPLSQIGPDGNTVDVSPGDADSHWYPVVRNTLWTLIGLFIVYLVFEFTTLWKRDFPVGFYYAGYAHQGAAWLTFALALATAILSLIFRGSMLRDPRLSRVRKSVWIWSVLNLILAIAVYNRLLIYVGYNGMTQMRTIGFFGITLVVIGFALVLWKIAPTKDGQHRSFWWLIRSQLVALVLTVIAYSLFPVDYLAHRYNASKVKSGYLPPSVMIAVKQTTNEGVFPLLQLVDSDDPIIREGVLAMLAQRQIDVDEDLPVHWTESQLSRRMLRQTLKSKANAWKKYANETKRETAIERFREYAMQWY